MFLCSFPLGVKRIRQHIEFFVRNINYELPSGRVASLLTIGQIIDKFPVKMLIRDAEYQFLALAANVARDHDSDCRKAAFECLRSLFLRLVGTRNVGDLLQIAYTLAGVHDGSNDHRQKSEKGKNQEKKTGYEGGKDNSDKDVEGDVNQPMINRKWRCDFLQEEQDQIMRRCGIACLFAACKTGKLNKRQLKLILGVIVSLFEHLAKEEKEFNLSLIHI